MKIKYNILLFIIMFTATAILLYLLLEIYTNLNPKSGQIPNQSEFWKEYYYINHKSESFMEGSTLKIYQYDSLLGWRITPNYSTNTFCGDKSFNSDSLGLRLNKKVSNIGNKKTVLFIGDSFVEGSEVSDHNTLSSLIEQLDTNYRVINAGVGGYGFDQIYIYLQKLLSHINPDIVILGYINTDIDRVNLSFRDYYKPFFTFKNDSLILHNKHIESPDVFLGNFSKQNDFTLLFKLLKSYNNYEKDKFLSSKIIENMVNYVENKKIPFYIYYLPSPIDLVNKSDYFYQDTIFRDIIYNIKEDIVFSPINYIYKKRDVLTKREGHWDSTGNYFLAKYFVDSVIPIIAKKE